jgi:hypothetical protein
MREGKLFESLIWTASAWESESQLRVERSDVESHSEKIQRYRFAATLQQCPALVASWKLQNPPPWSGRPTGFSFDASGQFVSIEGNVFMLGQPGESLVWRASDGKPAPILKEPGQNVLFSRKTPDGRLEFVVHRNFHIKLWDVAVGKLLHTFIIPKEELGILAESLQACELKISPDQRWLVAVVRSPVVGVVWDLESRREMARQDSALSGGGIRRDSVYYR